MKSCPLISVLYLSCPLCVLVTHVLLHAGLTSLFFWLRSRPLTHPRPSAQIYLLATNQLLVSCEGGT